MSIHFDPTQSFLLQLPTELRLHILSYLPEECKRPLLTSTYGIYQECYLFSTTVLLTCRTLCTEAQYIIRQLNKEGPHTLSCTVFISPEDINTTYYARAYRFMAVLRNAPIATLRRDLKSRCDVLYAYMVEHSLLAGDKNFGEEEKRKLTIFLESYVLRPKERMLELIIYRQNQQKPFRPAWIFGAKEEGLQKIGSLSTRKSVEGIRTERV